MAWPTSCSQPFASACNLQESLWRRRAIFDVATAQEMDYMIDTFKCQELSTEIQSLERVGYGENAEAREPLKDGVLRFAHRIYNEIMEQI